MNSISKSNSALQAKHSDNRCDQFTIVGLALLGFLTQFQMAVAAENGLNPQKNTIIKSTQLLAENQDSKQSEQERAWKEFFDSQYTYFDAVVLSKHWNQSLGDAKARIGNKLKAGAYAQATLEQQLLDGRIQAVSAANNQLICYPDSSYTYNDAEVLAKFWGERGPSEAKTRIEKNLIMGNEAIVKKALKLAKDEAH